MIACGDNITAGFDKRESVCESLSALCTSSLKYVSAVSSLHSLSEAMLLLSLSLFRLVSSEHYLHLLIYLSEACCLVAFTLLHNDTPYYNRTRVICQEIFQNSGKFPLFF